MKKTALAKNTAIILIAVIALISCKTGRNQSTYLDVEIAEIEIQLNNLLQTWYPRIIDSVHGGYWTNFENDWTLSEDQDKMLVTQARGLWTAARAAELFPDDPVYLLAADHGYEFLTRHMWDTVQGGFYQNFYADASRNPDQSFKITYGNAFALFALSQYAKVNATPEVLEWVKKSFSWLEENLHDSVDKGYFNVFIPASQVTAAAAQANSNRRAAWGNPAWKDQNTSIHLMEAFTVACQVLPEPAFKERLEEMLVLVRDSMTTDDGSLNLYFTPRWEAIINADSSRNYILENILTDHISFGHNIETAYLLVDAAQTLYGQPDSSTLAVAKKLLDHTLKYGFDRVYYGLFDKGYRFAPGNEVEIIDSTKVWWAQAEAWHALALFSGLYPQEPVYQKAFANMWPYITKEIVDPQFGGWYNSGIDRNPESVNQRKAHAWKGCYHDGRALMQVFSYTKNR